MKGNGRMLPIPECPRGCRAYHSINQTAALLAASREKVYELIRTGRLEAKDIPGIGKRVAHTEIDRFASSTHAA